MKHAKIVKRGNGTQYNICIDTTITNYSGGAIIYEVSVYYRNKGKRKWLSLPDTLHDFQYRSLSLEDRARHTEQNNLRFVSAEEIYSAKLEAWELLKPKL